MTTLRLPKPFTDAELAALRATPVRDDVRAVETFLHQTGMRSAEALSITLHEAQSWPLRRRWSRKPPATVRIIGKGDKERLVLLTPAAVRAARVLTDGRCQVNNPFRVLGMLPGYEDDETQIVRANMMVPFADRWLRELLQRHGDDAGVDCHAHRFRHTYITEHVEAGTPIEIVADMAGHSSVDITRLYYSASVRARAEAERRRGRTR